jgi:hypothetical protein
MRCMMTKSFKEVLTLTFYLTNYFITAPNKSQKKQEPKRNRSVVERLEADAFERKLRDVFFE